MTFINEPERAYDFIVHSNHYNISGFHTLRAWVVEFNESKLCVYYNSDTTKGMCSYMEICINSSIKFSHSDKRNLFNVEKQVLPEINNAAKQWIDSLDDILLGDELPAHIEYGC